MKKFGALLLTLCLALSLFGCAQSTPSSAPQAESTQQPAAESEDLLKKQLKDVKITFASRGDPTGADAESEYLIKRIDEFNAMDNGITVEIQWNPVEADYLDRLATDIATGDCPNVFMEYGGSRVLDYLNADILYNMSDVYAQDPDWKNSVYENMWSPCDFSDYGVEGLYGIPYNAYQVVLVYNKAYLEQCKLEVPKTWEELMNCAKVLQENGIQPFKVGEGDSYRFGHLFSSLAITSYGEEAIKIGKRETAYDSEQAKTIYQLMIDAYNAGYFGENILADNASQERVYMGAGECAFTWDLSSRIYWLEDSQELNAENLHVTAFPAVNKDYYGWFQGGASQALYVSTQGASEDEIAASLQFLRYITDTALITEMTSVTNATYAVKATTGSAERSYIYDEVAQIMSETKGLVNELQNYDTESSGVTIVRNALQTIVQGASADDVAKTIVDGFADLD